MKRTLFTLLLSFCLLSLIAQQETEPNGSFIEASIIALNTTIEAYIGELGDSDFFTFEIDEGGIVEVKILEAPSNIDLHLLVFESNSSDNQINYYYEANESDAFTLQTSTCQTGDFYIFLEDGGLGTSGGSAFNETVPYKFQVNFTPFDEVDKCECGNESINDACEIKFGTEIFALINPWYEFTLSNTATEDIDFYKVNVSDLSQIHLQIQDVPQNIKLEILIYNPDQELIWHKHNIDEGDSYDIWLSTCSTGFHYIQIRDGANIGPNGGSDFNAEEPYSFKIDKFSLISIDSSECNNSFNDATILEHCIEVTASISPSLEFIEFTSTVLRDIDYYKVDLIKDEETDILVEFVPSDIEICLSIYNQWHEIIESYQGNAGQPLNMTFIPSEDGIYFIEIQDCEGNFNPDENYTLKVGCNLISSTHSPYRLSNISVYPNPFTDELRIDFDSNINDEVAIRIYNLFGEQVYSNTTIIAKNIQVEVNNLPKGILIVEATINGGKSYSTILKI